MENHKKNKVRECFLNIANMQNIIVIKFKCNLATYKLNVYKTSVKQLQLFIIEHRTKCKFRESIDANIQNCNLEITLLKKTKNITNCKH